MARKFVTDPSLQPLVERLARLVHAEGSIQATSRRLNAALGSTPGGRAIYPNRLAALLSDDPTQTVNDKTIATIKEATVALGVPPGDPQASPALVLKIVQAWEHSPHRLTASDSSAVVTAIGETLQLPGAVVRCALTIAGKLQPTAPRPVAPPRAQPVRKPDWSFQDDAVCDTIGALEAEGGTKIGLVLPTGGGKTRVAMRIALQTLAKSAQNSVVLWVTHRRFLRTMATRELQRAMAAGTPDLPEDAVRLLGNRVEIVLVSQVAQSLQRHQGHVVLVIVDEAHHAAAPSYAPIFSEPGVRGLFLTATPNRSDARAIGIDRIAYTITYRDLFRRGVLVEPRFEPPLVLSPSAWQSQDGLGDLCDYILQRSRSDFTKTIVVASRIDYVERLYEALQEHLAEQEDPAITSDEIGFVHGSRCSSDATPDAYLDVFHAFERGILVTTAQMLGEGYDDPKVNAVVITYPTSSMVQLMQVGGRALRAAPGKTSAYIVQAKESDLAYHFEQRWLYRDIVDTLHPRLIDESYSDETDLRTRIEALLSRQRVGDVQTQAIREALLQCRPGEPLTLMLSGMPYAGALADFDSESDWHAVLVTPSKKSQFVEIFNEFSNAAPEVRATQFLAQYVPLSTEPTSTWMQYRDLLTAMQYARREVTDETYALGKNRPYDAHLGTTWLTYVTYHYRPTVPTELRAFLEDAINCVETLAAYAKSRERWTLVVKIPYPMDGTFACLLDSAQANWLRDSRSALTESLSGIEIPATFAQIALWRAGQQHCPLPQWLLERIETLLGEDVWANRTLRLQQEPDQPPRTSGAITIANRAEAISNCTG